MSHLSIHKGDAILHIGDRTPIHKRPVICIEQGARITVLGWLRDDFAVEDIVRMFGPEPAP